MKQFLVGVAILISFHLSSAVALNSLSEALKLRDMILESRLFDEVKEVNSIGIGACDPDTGLPQGDSNGHFVYCVQITTESEAAKNIVEQIFLPQTPYQSIFVTVKVIKKLVPKP